MINASVIGTDFFASDTERIFICNKEIRQIIVPEIFIKAKIGCDRQQTFDLCIDFADQYRIALGTFFKFPENLAHLI